MSDEIKVNKQPAQPVTVVEHSSQSTNKMPWIILAAVVVVLAVLGFVFRGKLFGMDKKEAMSAKASGYQAIFLTNGQVYFGKVSAADSEYVVLKDIYYLQVIQQQPLQGTQQDQAASQAQQQISLVKLGNELHGPMDEMHISKTQILFYEDLKEDGNVVKAIQQYKATPQNSQQPAAQQQAPAATAPGQQQPK